MTKRGNEPATNAALAEREKTCPGCSTRFVPIPPSRVYCRPTCGARHQRTGQALLPLHSEPVSELPSTPRRGTRGGPIGFLRGRADIANRADFSVCNVAEGERPLKATHKFKVMPRNVNRIVADAPSIAEACRRLGVNRSTLHRWITAGKVQRPGSRKDEPVQSDADARAALSARIALAVAGGWDPRRAWLATSEHQRG